MATARSLRARDAGWLVSDTRVERVWQREGLKVPQKQPKRGRLWLTNGSCIRLRPEHSNHVWSYDFVEDRTHDGRKYRMLNVIDEFTHECLAIRINRKLKAVDVIDVLSDLFILRGVPSHIDPTMGLSSSPRPYRIGSQRSEPRPPTSHRAAPGKTASSRASTLVFVTNCLTARSSTRCVKPRSSSRAGGATTTPSDLTPRSATGRRHHRSSSRYSPRGRLRWRPVPALN